MVSSLKVMLAIVWNTEGSHVVGVLPKGATFGTDYYYCEDILSGILRAYLVCSNRRLVVRADNPRLHTSKRTREFMKKSNLRGAQHPPFSLDLAPSDILLFYYIKSKLQGTQFTEKDNLLAEIQEKLNEISGKVLNPVSIE
jgi:histone-lysine N-methyltransferase SETMAR